MSADARSVSTDALATLGTIIDDKQKRDAIHLAVMPVVAGDRLVPGEDVGLNANGTADGYSIPKIGIVDPFLKVPVRRTERFWLVIYPRVISSLRHVWSHPGIADEAGTPAVPESVPIVVDPHRDWLIRFAAEADLTLNALMEGAKDYVENGEYLSQGGKWEGFYAPVEFWEHYDAVAGVRTPEDKRYNFFSCGC